METDNFKEAAFQLRDACEALKGQIQKVKNDAGFVYDMSQCHDPAEAIENLQLAYRHLEDARMRVGKAIQAYDGKDVLPR